MSSGSPPPIAGTSCSMPSGPTAGRCDWPRRCARWTRGTRTSRSISCSSGCVSRSRRNGSASGSCGKRRAISRRHGRATARALFTRLAGEVDGELQIVADPPLIVPIEDLALPGTQQADIEASMRRLLRSYRRKLSSDHHPLEEFRYLHTARKVVGVGSVGTRAWILLLVGRDDDDPLFLQAKEAQASVLERFLEPSRHDNHARRVVAGQRLMQAASDIFLGWQRVVDLDGVTRDYYLRQLHDWKGAVDVESMRVAGRDAVRAALRRDARPRARPVRRPYRDRVVPGQGRRVRPGGGRLRRRVRGSERAGLRGARGCREGGHGRGGDRALAAASRGRVNLS